MKKILKVGCLSIVGIFVLLSVIAIIFGEDQTNSELKSETTPVDSAELVEQKRLKDSLDRIAEVRKEEAIESLKSFHKKSDEFKEASFYRDKRTPNYTNFNFIYPYIVEKGGKYWLRLKMQYTADDWLFIRKAILLADGEKFYITGNWERDNDTSIWEWLDISAKDSEIAILKKIANAKSSKVRYEGTKYHDDRTITSKEKDIIKKTLEIYEGLKQ